MITVLTPLDTSDWARNILTRQLETYNTTRLEQEQAVVAAKYQQQINGIALDGDKWKALKGDLREVVSLLTRTVDRVESIRELAVEAKSVAFMAQYGDATSSKTYETQFNVLLRRINSLANQTERNGNLLGETTVSPYTYTTDIYRATETVADTDLTTGYYIIDSGGRKWVHDSATPRLLAQRDPDSGVETGVYSSVDGNIRLDSLVGDAITFTIDYETAGAAQYSGTLYRTGLEVADAWVYEGLSTAAGRTTAINDLDTAIRTVDLHLVRLSGELAMAEFYLGKAEVNSDSSASRINTLTAEQMVALQDAQDQASQRTVVGTAVLDGNRALRDQYLKMLGMGTSQGVMGALLDALA